MKFAYWLSQPVPLRLHASSHLGRNEAFAFAMDEGPIEIKNWEQRSSSDI